MLYILNKSPFILSSASECFASLSKNDALLLIEDGIYAALIGSTFQIKNDVRVFALSDDVIARGMQEKLSPEVELIDYNGFVALTIKFYPICNW